MTPTEYWKKELAKATELATTNLEVGDDPQIVAALVLAGQLQSLATILAEIRSQLAHIEDAIQNQ